ncbi:MAG: ATP cone domain-containing protein, partial [Pygmaiobacter sp.]
MATGIVKTIVKRDGRVVLYDETKIASAVLKALIAAGSDDPAAAARIANAVGASLSARSGETPPTIEHIQDAVETELMREGFDAAAKKYI